MSTIKRDRARPGDIAVSAGALAFFAVVTWASYAHWANFEYRTFDLAYYVQALWQLLHGRVTSSVLGVPILGNHVEPVIFVFLPFFLLVRHPMVLVVLQNLALAAMAPLAFHTGCRLGLDRRSSLLLAGALLLAPATGYVALHEFHPEALAAPLILLMINARLRGAFRTYWTAAISLLACKENMALLVAAYCAIHFVLERKRPFAELRRWYLWPLVLSVFWFVLCAKVISPALNSGGIDYLQLYNRLGSSGGDILTKAITEPQRVLGALAQSLRHGNLVWALLLPFLGLPLLRPRWLLIATPILLQHLLSWRSSEWQVYFHYGAPLIPLFWMALAEGAGGVERWTRIPGWFRTAIPVLVVAACCAAQALVGPAPDIISTVTEWRAGHQARALKLSFANQITPEASVVAPLAYLSHLAMRERLFSLHFILKGLKTLSHDTYEPPPPTDFVLIDYGDTATFDPIAGYYHPTMKTADQSIIPSSDRLLHDFLRRSSWTVTSTNELTLFRNGAPVPHIPENITRSGGPILIERHTTLKEIGITAGGNLSTKEFQVAMNWSFQNPREVFPWMFLRVTPKGGGSAITISRGLCSPEWPDGEHPDSWHMTPTSNMPPGDYDAEAVFVDHARLLWSEKSPSHENRSEAVLARIPLGQVRAEQAGSSAK